MVIMPSVLTLNFYQLDGPEGKNIDVLDIVVVLKVDKLNCQSGLIQVLISLFFIKDL